MSKAHGLVRVAIIVAAAAACVGVAVRLREQRAAVDRAADAIEDEVNALDPVARAAVVARLAKDVKEDVTPRALRHGE